MERDPCFSGEWAPISHDNLEALLRVEGVPEDLLPKALRASRTLRQTIHHTSALANTLHLITGWAEH